MTHFYIVRHGNTLFNQLKRYQGWCDSPLTDLGIAQAKALRPILKDIPFVLAASSTSERARDTLDAIIYDEAPKVYLKGLREVYFGQLEGSLWFENKPSPEVDWQGYAYCQGEDRDQALERFKNALISIAKEGNVLVVSHGAVICRLLQQLDPNVSRTDSPAHIVPNCSVTRIDYNDGVFSIRAYPQVF